VAPTADAVADKKICAGQAAQIGGSTERVTFSTLQDDDLDIGKNAVIYGTLIAPRRKFISRKIANLKAQPRPKR